MGKKDTENAVYIAIISGAIGLLWDMLMNPCGKHWIPFFNSPSIDVACILKKGGLRLLPPIPPLGRSGGAGSSSKKDDDKKGRGDDDDDDDKGGGSIFGSGGSGSGGRIKPPREDEPERTLDEILSGIRKESGKQESISRRRMNSDSDIERTRAYIRGKRAEGTDAGDYLDELLGRTRGYLDKRRLPRRASTGDFLSDLLGTVDDNEDVNRFVNDPIKGFLQWYGDSVNSIGKTLGGLIGENWKGLSGGKAGGIRPILPIP